MLAAKLMDQHDQVVSSDLESRLLSKADQHFQAQATEIGFQTFIEQSNNLFSFHSFLKREL